MRYGIVREAGRLPPAVVQKRLLEACACDVLLEEGEPTHEAQHRLLRLLRALKAGDEVVVHSLDSFQRPTGELAQLLRDFLAVGVSLKIVGEPGGADLLADLPTPRLLVLLAEHESRRPPLPTGNGYRRERRTLTRHQINYARKLYKEGASLREIGLLFQVSPNEAMDMVRD